MWTTDDHIIKHFQLGFQNYNIAKGEDSLCLSL